MYVYFNYVVYAQINLSEILCYEAVPLRSNTMLKQHLQTDMRNELSAHCGRNDGGSWSLAKNVNVTGIL